MPSSRMNDGSKAREIFGTSNGDSRTKDQIFGFVRENIKRRLQDRKSVVWERV